MNLEEARKLATPGPLVGSDGVLCVSDGGRLAYLTLSAQPDQHRKAVTTAALLAHAYNMLPELVKTIDRLIKRAEINECSFLIERDDREVLARVKEVPGI